MCHKNPTHFIVNIELSVAYFFTSFSYLDRENMGKIVTDYSSEDS